jgi:endonuclease/exonuclease/phosphatase family metal-dependent hydrolase
MVAMNNLGVYVGRRESIMRVISYNILNPFHALKYKTKQGLTKNKKQSNWEDRKVQIKDNLNSYDFHIACLQEVSPSTISSLREDFNIEAYCEHSNLDPNAIHGPAIAVNTDRLEVIEAGSVQTPDPQRYRSASFVKVKNHDTGIVSAILSVHLEGYNPDEPNQTIKSQAKHEGYEELKTYTQFLESKDADVYVLAGDFNENAGEINETMSRCAYLLDAGFAFDGDLTPTEKDKNRKLDWVFVKSSRSYDLSPLDNPPPHAEASDHSPCGSVITVLKI